LKSYEKSSLEYIGNSNSLHELGLKSKKLEDAAGKQILDILGVPSKEIIYTSGNCESYTLIVENIDESKNIVTNNRNFYDFCMLMGRDVRFGDVLSLIDNNTGLVSLNDAVILVNYNGPIHIDISFKYDFGFLNNYDFITIEDEIPFFGCLIKNKNRELIPVIHGGKSTTKYRSGTSPTSLIVSFSKLIKLKYKK